MRRERDEGERDGGGTKGISKRRKVVSYLCSSSSRSSLIASITIPYSHNKQTNKHYNKQKETN